MAEQEPNPTNTNDSLSGENLTALKSDFSLMFQHATNQGLELPTNLLLDQNDKTALVGNYNALRKVIQPATVESIQYIHSDNVEKRR